MGERAGPSSFPGLLSEPSGTIAAMTDANSAPDDDAETDAELESLGWTHEENSALKKIMAANRAALRASVLDSSKKLRLGLDAYKKPLSDAAETRRELQESFTPQALRPMGPEALKVSIPINPLIKPIGELVQLNASLLDEQQRLRAEAEERDKNATRLARAVLFVAIATLAASVVVPLLIWWLSA